MKFTAAFTAAIVAAVPFFANASYIRPIARNGQCLVGNEQCCSNYGTVDELGLTQAFAAAGITNPTGTMIASSCTANLLGTACSSGQTALCCDGATLVGVTLVQLGCGTV